MRPYFCAEEFIHRLINGSSPESALATPRIALWRAGSPPLWFTGVLMGTASVFWYGRQFRLCGRGEHLAPFADIPHKLERLGVEGPGAQLLDQYKLRGRLIRGRVVLVLLQKLGDYVYVL